MQVIIADDDGLSRKILEDNCLQWGYEVVCVENGTLAWELYQQEDSPRIFLLDWVMPGYSGVDLCHMIREQENNQYTYIIIITALNHTENLIQGLEAGADDYITKPFNLNELRCRLDKGKRILELEDKIMRMANLDYLTGLYNRRYFFQRMDSEISRCRREDKYLGVLMLDIDEFKNVNDRFGHTGGDHVLVRVAEVLKRSCRSYDIIGRFGGEEFIICLPGANPEETSAIAERIRANIEQEQFVCSEERYHVTVSIGFISSLSGDRQALVNQADQALYQAKRQGKNRCCSYPATQ